MKSFVLPLFVVIFLTVSFSASSQCGAGETEITMTLYTDAWGYELYWELYPEGSSCGENSYLTGGNADQVGCTGAGEQDAQGGNGYASNATIEIDPVCVPTGEPLVLQFIDDWGDGGATFEVFEDGQFVGFYVGSGSGNTWVFTPGESNIPIYDEPCSAENIEVDGPSLLLNNENAIASLNEVSPGGGNCSLPGIWCEGAVTNSIWASFTAPDEGSIEITTCLPGTSTDTQIALWQGNDCSDQSSFSLIAANDDMLSGCGNGNGFASTMYAGCLNPGETYFIQIDGWNGATGDIELQVLTYDNTPVLNAFVNSIPCALNKGEQGDGSLFPYIVGFGESFEAEWEGPNGFTSSEQDISGLNPGAYTLTATTACGEVLTGTFEITMPAPISATFDVTHPQCPLSGDGVVSPEISGGALPFTYEWSGPDEFTSEEAIPENLNEGQYNLLVTDNNGCTFEQNLTLTATNEIDLNLGNNTELCNDDLTVLSGPVGYDYTWQDGSINQFFVVDGEALGVGTYNFVLNVTNPEGCDATDAVTIEVIDCSVSVDELSTQFAVWPNPATDVLNLKGMQQGAVLQLHDLTGRCVLIEEVQHSAKALDVNNFARGQYVLTLLPETGDTVVRRVIVLR